MVGSVIVTFWVVTCTSTNSSCARATGAANNRAATKGSTARSFRIMGY